MDSKIEFGKMVNFLRKRDGLTMEELGVKLGKTKSTISRWVSGERYPKIEEIEEIAIFFNVDIETLIFGANHKSTNITSIYNELEPPRQEKVYSFAEKQLEEQKEEKVVNIDDYKKATPVTTINTAVGGSEYYYGDNYNELRYTDEELEPYDFALDITGNSMCPIINDGDVVVVRKSFNFQEGYVYIVDIDGESLVKQVYDEGDEWCLCSYNEKYEDRYVKKSEHVRIIGQVVDWFTPVEGD